MTYRDRNAFTLIELLIVVAIIAILAAIAVPNFLEAQVRSKVSRCKSDMRSIATALEAYCVDASAYPPDSTFYRDHLGVGTVLAPNYPSMLLCLLTTPVSYITSVPNSVFPDVTPSFFPDEDVWYPERGKYYQYWAQSWKKEIMGQSGYPGAGDTPSIFLLAYGYEDNGHQWTLSTSGPDRIYNHGPWGIFGQNLLNHLPPIAGSAGRAEMGYGCLYDPSNGTLSTGDIVRFGP